MLGTQGHARSSARVSGHRQELSAAGHTLPGRGRSVARLETDEGRLPLVARSLCLGHGAAPRGGRTDCLFRFALSLRPARATAPFTIRWRNIAAGCSQAAISWPKTMAAACPGGSTCQWTPCSPARARSIRAWATLPFGPIRMARCAAHVSRLRWRRWPAQASRPARFFIHSRRASWRVSAGRISSPRPATGYSASPAVRARSSRIRFTRFSFRRCGAGIIRTVNFSKARSCSSVPKAVGVTTNTPRPSALSTAAGRSCRGRRST